MPKLRHAEPTGLGFERRCCACQGQAAVPAASKFVGNFHAVLTHYAVKRSRGGSFHCGLMLANAKLVQRPLADQLRIGFDFRLRDLHDLLGNELGELIGAAAGEFQYAAGFLVSLDHRAGFLRIQRSVLKQPIDRHDTPPGLFAGGRNNWSPSDRVSA
jgi:hypothetical protein